MIPASQRPDGSWRKTRRVRKGFDPNSGGVPRYVPPAYRNAAGGHESGEDHTIDGERRTRSLTEVESLRSGGRRSRHLPAVLFLRTASTALPSSPNHECKRSSSAESALSTTAEMMALARSAVRAAEEQLGCGDCRLIVSEEVPADKSTTNSFSRSSEDDGCTRDWWAQLRQVEQRSEKEEKSWIGVELSLRWSDGYCSEGQAAIIGFLRSLVGRKEAEDGERESENGVKAGARQTTAKPEDGKNGRVSSEDEEENRSSGALHESPEDRDSDSVGVIAAAVLVFGGELSKRDRAGLHGHAEKTVGVESSSHGVGDARFLALRCDLGGGSSTTVGFELSREQEELARRLFRLAQQEYHSRYERWSHREIREVVAHGGPCAEDHPDLFQLLERIDHGVDPDVPKRRY